MTSTLLRVRGALEQTLTQPILSAGRGGRGGLRRGGGGASTRIALGVHEGEQGQEAEGGDPLQGGGEQEGGTQKAGLRATAAKVVPLEARVASLLSERETGSRETAPFYSFC